MDDSPAPTTCPRCRKVLYPISHLRPRPALSPMARLILTAAVLSATLIFWTIALLIRFSWHPAGWIVPGRLLWIVALPPALIPGIAIALIAYRLPLRLKLRCAACGWNELYRLPRRPPSRPLSARIQSAPTQPSHSPPARPSGFDQIVDEGQPRAEAAAWAYAETAAGRMPEDVAADLVASGWPADDAQAMAQRAFRETRNLRAARSHTPR